MAANPRTGLLIILDGFGINPDPRFNAVAQARTPTLDYLYKTYPHSELDASEGQVGLPRGFMGNSEVGHLNLGAGRIVFQDFSLISRAIEDETFFSNPVMLELLSKLKDARAKPTLHLIGLVSDGGVHSHISHLFALLQLAKREGVERVAIHAITDGRDTSPTSSVDFLGRLKGFCRDLGVGKIATVMGRFYAMDRDNRWERTEKAYRAIVSGEASRLSDVIEYVRGQYASGTTDEFLSPAAAPDYPGIQDGDGVLFFNFRADRARQLTRALTQTEFLPFRRHAFPVLAGFVCLTPYDETFRLPAAFEKPKVSQTLGEIVSQQGWRQLRIAETEKYAHVTYFFNGGDERVFEGEKRLLIPSPREVRTYDLKPEMSAFEVTEKLLAELKTGQYQFAVVNFANCDMVGHTGNLAAAVRAVEAVDSCLGKLIPWVEEEGAFAVLTADHGNCEIMQDGEGYPLTSHTLLRVPFFVIDPKKKNRGVVDGRLCDVAPTLLGLWGIPQPVEMTGKSLLA